MKTSKLLLLATACAVLTAPAVANAGDHSNRTAGHSHHHSQKTQSSIVDIAVSNKDFSTLVAALQAADLVGALQGDGPFTVFAPTNEAFAKLPKATLDNLLKPENKTELAAILKYHVVPGLVPAKAAMGAKTKLKTLAGGTMSVDGTGGGVKVENADVIKADIKGTNGIIHVVDEVILPQ